MIKETFKGLDIDYISIMYDAISNECVNNFAITRVKHYGDMRVYYTASLY